MPENRVLRRIHEAAGNGRLVSVTRRKGWDRIEGSILAHRAKWLLMATEVDAGFYGHTLVRVADVRRVDPLPAADFVEQALAAEGQWPLPSLGKVDLTSTRAALSSLTQTGSLPAIFYEREHPDECEIGVPRDIERRKFQLQTVSPNAEWDGDDVVFRYSSVTRIDVGGAYERRLSAVAGHPPGWPSA